MRLLLSLFFITLCIPLSIHAQGSTSGRIPSPTATDSSRAHPLGRELVNFIKSTTEIKFQIVTGWRRENRTTGIQGYPTHGEARPLNAEQQKKLKKILTNPRSYVISSVKKRCEFIPEFAFEMKKGNQKKYVLVAMNCDLIEFSSGANDAKLMETDSAHNSLSELATAIGGVWQLPGLRPPLNDPFALHDSSATPLTAAPPSTTNRPPAIPPTTTPNDSVAARTAESTITYTVKQGDILGNIANKHSVKLQDLQNWNAITNPNQIKIGQKLKIHK